MSPDTDSPVPGVRRVSRNPWHFHTGRWALLAEGALLVALGVLGWCSAASHPDAGSAGAPVLILHLTPWHSALLGGTGLILALSALRRRSSVIISATVTVGYLLLVFYGAVASAHHAPGPLGLGAQSIVVHGVIAALNLGILYWLLPDALEGPDWVRRSRTDAPRAKGTPR